MRILFSLLVCLFSTLASATAFKCVGVDGRVTYSSFPCVASEKSSVLFPAVPVRSITLKSNGDGSFSGSGKFKSVPIIYLVDTGASNTSISGRVAFVSGIHVCERSGYSQTANGIIANCAVNADIELGGILFKNHRVYINQNMGADMLLGTDILQTMKMEQADGVMVLSR